MKLFSWMHRKSKTDITSSVTGSNIGLKSSLDNQGIYATPNTNNYSTLKWLPQNHYFEDFSAENYEELNTRENDEIFPGFLTIGTLSIEPVTEPSTPTFCFSSQNTDEEKKADIKYDLKHISENLDKSLEDESEEKNHSTSNNAQASMFISSDEVKEEASNAADQLYPRETEEKGTTSLHRLFKKGIMTKRSSISGDEKNDRKAAKEHKLSKNLTNKMLWIPPICSVVSVASAVKPLPKATKPSKMKGLFHKKIHPEISKVATEDDNGYSNYESERVVNNSKSTITKSNKIGCWTSLTTNGKKHRFKTDMKSSADTVINKNLDLLKHEMAGCCASREHWINTDDEFFVLELQENKGKPVYN